jgi:hypothetical protein
MVRVRSGRALVAAAGLVLMIALAGEWDAMGGQQKQKWLEIAIRFPSMTPDEQQRVQQRMREWVKLTPEQRRMVRENYARAKKLEPSQKSAQWQQYQQLPEEEKLKLAADADKTKHVADPPSPSQSRVKTVAPIKSGVIPPAAAPAPAGPGVIVITPGVQPLPPAASAASAPGNGK